MLRRLLGYALLLFIGLPLARAALLWGGPPAMVLVILALAGAPFYWRFVVEWLKSLKR